jgi:hypothetical protein
VFGIPWNWWAAGLGLIGLLLWQFWPGISSLFGKIKLPSLGGTKAPAPASRAKAVDAVDYLIVFFKDCPEGQALARKCGQHLFDEHTGGGA